jgi:GNAT superfamily N-acetyltransferase
MEPVFSPLAAQEIDIALEMMRKLYAKESSTWSRERARAATEYLLAHAEFGGVWLIRVDGVVAGYLVLTVSFSLEFGGRFGLLDEIFLEEPWRCQGIGSRALAFASKECRARGLQAVRLEVGHDNPRAAALYRDCGYKADARDLMTKWL